MDRQRVKSVVFWIATIFGPASFVIGGVINLKGGPEVATTMAHLGYPLYFAGISAPGNWPARLRLPRPGCHASRSGRTPGSCSTCRPPLCRAPRSATALPT